MPSPSGATATYGFPYLEETDIPDVAVASEELAQAVENEFIVIASVVAGTLPSPYDLTESLGTFLTTGSLAVGKWRIEFNGFANLTTLGEAACVDIKIAEGSATATFQGPTSATAGVGGYSGDAYASISFTTVVVVTSAGTIVYQAISNTPSSVIESTSALGSYPGATGYVATRIS